MEPIVKRDFTDPAKSAAEATAIELATEHTDKVLADYAARPDTFEGRYVCADTFKELMPGYARSRESRNELNGAVHNASAVLSSEQFRRIVDSGPQPGRDKVVFVTGIPGAGKSSTIARAVADSAAVVFEGQMSRPEPAMQKIEHALQKGFKVAIVAVHVAPEVALERTHSRYIDPNNGRGASISVMSDIQGNLPAGLRRIQEQYGQKVALTVLENNPSQQRFHKGWGAILVLEKEGHREYIRKRLTTELDAGYRDGRYSAGFYTQAAGREPERVRHLVAGVGREDGRAQQADGNRSQIPQANAGHDALTAHANVKLDSQQHEAIYKEVIAPYYLPRSKPQEHPCVIITGGQPGSGKSGLTKMATERFRESGYVLVDADKVRPYHPQYDALMEADDKMAANLTHPDAGQWARRLMQDGIAGRRNLIIDQTSSNPEAVAALTKELRQAGYRIEMHVMAVPHAVSLQRIYQRYEDQHEQFGSGRFSTQDKHDEAFLGIAKTVTAVEAARQVDHLALYDKDRQQVYQNRLVQGEWEHQPCANHFLSIAREQPLTLEDARALADGYQDFMQRLAKRNAPNDERAVMHGHYMQAERVVEKLSQQAGKPNGSQIATNWQPQKGKDGPER